MDFWISPDSLNHILWTGGFWVVLSVLWVSASLWIASDAGLIFGDSPWPLISVLFGAFFFVTTYMWGLNATPIFAIVFISGLFFYTFTRDKKAPTQERILCVAFLKKILVKIPFQKSNKVYEVKKMLEAKIIKDTACGRAS